MSFTWETLFTCIINSIQDRFMSGIFLVSRYSDQRSIPFFLVLNWQKWISWWTSMVKYVVQCNDMCSKVLQQWFTEVESLPLWTLIHFVTHYYLCPLSPNHYFAFGQPSFQRFNTTIHIAVHCSTCDFGKSCLWKLNKHDPAHSRGPL